MKSTDTICTKGQDKLCWFFCAVVVVAGLAVLLTGCSDGPTESDMRGCATRRAGTEITRRDVADCAVERAARQGEVK